MYIIIWYSLPNGGLALMAWHRKFQKSSPTQLLGNEQLCFFQPSNWMQPVGTETNLVNRINWSATTSDVWEKMINHMCPLGLSDPERCLLCWVSNSFSRGYFSACYGLVPRAASWRARSWLLDLGDPGTAARHGWTYQVATFWTILGCFMANWQ
jgi:hypothetical protein